LDPLYISGTAEATNFKTLTQIDYKKYYRTGDIEKLAAFDMYVQQGPDFQKILGKILSFA